MNPAILDIDVAVLADWLAAQESDRLWTVDGEPLIEETLPLPCSGTDLAELLKARRGRVRLFGPTGVQAIPAEDMSGWAEKEEDGGLMFELSWLSDGEEGDHWVIVEDMLAEEADRAASQHASL